MRPRLVQLHQSGATDGQVPVWDATAGAWEAGDATGSGGSTIVVGEILMKDGTTPPEPLTTEDGTDYLYADTGVSVGTGGSSGGVELAYAEITSDVVLGTSDADITGLTITFTVGTRPVYVEAVAPLLQSASADNPVIVKLTDGSNNQKSWGGGTVAAASGYMPSGLVATRLAAGSGTVTYKLRGSRGSGGTASVLASATAPAWIRAREV